MKNKLSKLYLFAMTTFFSLYFGAQEVFAEPKTKVNTKYFGEDQPFWENAQTLFAFISGIAIFIGILMTMAGMIWAAKKASIAKMQGNSQEFLRQTKNYAKFVINIGLMILFTGLIGLFFAWIIGFKTSGI